MSIHNETVPPRDLHTTVGSTIHHSRIHSNQLGIPLLHSLLRTFGATPSAHLICVGNHNHHRTNLELIKTRSIHFASLVVAFLLFQLLVSYWKLSFVAFKIRNSFLYRPCVSFLLFFGSASWPPRPPNATRSVGISGKA